MFTKLNEWLAKSAQPPAVKRHVVAAYYEASSIFRSMLCKLDEKTCIIVTPAELVHETQWSEGQTPFVSKEYHTLQNKLLLQLEANQFFCLPRKPHSFLYPLTIARRLYLQYLIKFPFTEIHKDIANLSERNHNHHLTEMRDSAFSKSVLEEFAQLLQVNHLYCDVCFSKTARYECSNCSGALYCSSDCQRWDWQKHKLFCSLVYERIPNIEQKKPEIKKDD